MAAWIGASDPVVADLDAEHLVVHIRPDLSAPGVRVLDDVRKRLGHDEVRAGLDLRREPLGRDIHLNRKVEPRHERVDAGPQAAAREGRGKDAVCQLAQLRVAALRVLERLVDERSGLSVLLSERLLSELERDDRVHQALLCAVVQIAHDAAAGLVRLR